MEENETETLTIEKIEIAGEIVDEPILSKSIRELKLGSKHRKISIGPFFCKCGKTINKENVARCSHCGQLLCQDCKIVYVNEVHCKECLKNSHQISLTKEEYMVEFCVFKEIASATTIFKLTGVPPETVRSIICAFMDKYLTQKPASFLERFFPKLRLTNLGNDALHVFDLIYGKDADCISMKQRILEFIEEKAKRTYSLRTEEDTTCSKQGH